MHAAAECGPAACQPPAPAPAPVVFDLLRVALQHKLGKVGEQLLVAGCPRLQYTEGGSTTRRQLMNKGYILPAVQLQCPSVMKHARPPPPSSCSRLLPPSLVCSPPHSSAPSLTRMRISALHSSSSMEANRNSWNCGTASRYNCNNGDEHQPEFRGRSWRGALAAAPCRGVCGAVAPFVGVLSSAAAPCC